MTKIIAGFHFENRVLALQTQNLEETIKHLVPQFVYCGKPIEGKNVQHKLEVALGYEVKTQKLPEIHRMKIVLEQLVDGAAPTNKLVTSKDDFKDTEATLTWLAGTIGNVLAAEAAAKTEAETKAKAEAQARKDAKKAEREAIKAKAEAEAVAKPEEVKPEEVQPEEKVEEVRTAQASAPTVMAKPARDAKGRFLPRN